MLRSGILNQRYAGIRRSFLSCTFHGDAMRKEDVEQLAERCRMLAAKADSFTQKRLQDLALRYEAMYPKRPHAPTVDSPAMRAISQPITARWMTIQPSDYADYRRADGSQALKNAKR
jgi:hypothetical protein